MMQARVFKAATLQDVIDAPPHVTTELVDGVLVQSKPSLRHQNVVFRLGLLIGPMDRKGGGWIFFNEPELHLRGNVLVPDVAAWRIERMADVPDTAAAVDYPPDWLCEVLSPSTELSDRSAKAALYGQAGVEHIWLVDPRRRLLEVHERLATGGYGLRAAYEGEAVVCAPPFSEVSFPLTDLWPAR